MFDPDDLPFPRSLPEFQKLFPGDPACAAYLEAIRWRDGFRCVWCNEQGEPYRFNAHPHVLRCRKCQRDNSLVAGTVMERSHTPLSMWYWGAYLVSTHTQGISATSSSANSVSNDTRPLFRFFTNCGPEWCDRSATASVVILKITSS